MTRAPLHLVLLATLGCNGGRSAEKTPSNKAPSKTQSAEAGGDENPRPGSDEEDEEQAEAEAKHTVVFADRTSQAYLLLVRHPVRPEPPTRDQFEALVNRTYRATPDAPEAVAMRRLVRTEPKDTQRSPEDLQALATDKGQAKLAAENDDLLGLAIDVIPADEMGVPTSAFDDPVLTRGLEQSQTLGLAGRKWAILLRADYRNQESVRGLRLLQRLAAMVAEDRDALILDADTWETWSVESFRDRALNKDLHNAGEQIAVVPFPEDDGIRLCTRGMRRFGSVDLELTGLPMDPATLQRGTDFLLALVRVMVREGEADSTGFAVEAGELIEVSWSGVAVAYESRGATLEKCDDCPGATFVHLVKREPRPTDATEHVVAQVVAPRDRSDDAAYDHSAWVMEALADVFGPAPSTR